MVPVLVNEREILDGVFLVQQPHVGFVAGELVRHFDGQVVAICIGFEENGEEGKVVWVVGVVVRLIAAFEGVDMSDCGVVKDVEVGVEVKGGGIATCLHVICELGDVGELHLGELVCL